MEATSFAQLHPIESVERLLPQPLFLDRPRVAGKFLFIGSEKFYIRGVTYGTFAPDLNGNQFPDRRVVERDFQMMAANGLNAIRTYTVPPGWLLRLATEQGLRVMVGMPWEQHIAFLDDNKRVKSIIDRVRTGVASCAEHRSAILCYGIGNEIPASIVRWHGRKRVEYFLERLHQAAKAEDPEGLFTYVNFPSTEYLRLPFLDIACFNVYLEKKETLEVYLDRLQNLAGNAPLLMAEIGLDSRRNGLEKQASTLDWELRSSFAKGCAGAFVFAWTDEWHRGGHDILDWDFGVTTRDRQPKPALETIRNAFLEAPFPPSGLWPKISVVVCTYNGSRTLRECLEGLRKVEYPNYEVIVVNDGSTDNCAEIATEYEVRLISTENRGLSSARNTGMEAATGEIVAYIDDDAYPDPHWLMYLASLFRASEHAAMGGPNIAPPGDGLIADCIVNAPGGPVHVLLNDREAEHVPGCNMAFRREKLKAIGGFDPQFRSAGDDVDLCWRVLQNGWTIGFHPAAVVWHHRRNSVKAYWKQQRGYGTAEALLENKWPEKYNAVGHIKWSGRLYGKGLTRILFKVQRVYHGFWGSAPFQGLHESPPSVPMVLPTMPEWYLVIIALGGLSALALLWPKLIFAIPFFLLAAGATAWQSILSSSEAVFPSAPHSRLTRWKLHAITAVLHLAQPLARLWGRASHGLTAWRRRMPRGLLLPVPRHATLWSEQWRGPEDALSLLAKNLRADGAVLVFGGDYDRWDLEVRGGMFGSARLFMATEEHGSGRQLFRFRFWPRFSWEVVVAIILFTALSLAAARDQRWAAYDILGLCTLLLLGRTFFEAGSAMAAIRRTLNKGLPEKP